MDEKRASDRREERKDEWIIVLDFLPQGHMRMKRTEPVAQVIGDKYFTLLEVIPREGIVLKPYDRVYIGEGKRNYVKYIRSRVKTDELSAVAKNELELVIEKVIDNDEKRFVDFYNKSKPITTRMNQLELLPGVGQKHMWAIIEERKKKEFESFDDIKKRITLLPHPKKAIIKRIISEIDSKDRYHIFTISMGK